MSRLFLPSELVAAIKQSIINQSIPSLCHEYVKNEWSPNSLYRDYIKQVYGDSVFFKINDKTHLSLTLDKKRNTRVSYADGVKQIHESCEKKKHVLMDNYLNGRELLSATNFNSHEVKYLEKSLDIELRAKEGTLEKAQCYLSEYVSDFENGDLYLPEKILYNQEAHFNRFMGLISELLQRANTKNIPVSLGVEVGDFNYRYKDLEYVLLLERKGFIRIHEVSYVDSKTIFVRIDILKGFKEIEDIYNNWLCFANLSLRPDSGHAYNGKIADKHFRKDQPAFKLLKALLENPLEKFSVEMLEQAIETDNSTLDMPIRKKRIDDLISGQIRKHLKMTDKESRVNILSSEGLYWLSAIPR